MDQLPRFGKRELICLLLFTCNYVVFVWRGFLFLWVLEMPYVILLLHSLSLPYNYLENQNRFDPLANGSGTEASQTGSDKTQIYQLIEIGEHKHQ